MDPQPDENGFPTNPEYLNALGFDPVAANRAIVSAETQLQQLYQALSDPQQRAIFLNEFDRALQEQDRNTEVPKRPVFPGPSSYDQSWTPEAAFQQAIRFGNPVDAFDRVAQIWGQVPAQYVAEQILASFPDVD